MYWYVLKYKSDDHITPIFGNDLFIYHNIFYC